MILDLLDDRCDAILATVARIKQQVPRAVQAAELVLQSVALDTVSDLGKVVEKLAKLAEVLRKELAAAGNPGTRPGLFNDPETNGQARSEAGKPEPARKPRKGKPT